MERDTGRLSALFRFPIKSLSAEPLDTVLLDPDRPLPSDRRFAFAEADSDAGCETWLPKRHILQLARFPTLAEVTARVDLDARKLQLFHRAQGKIAARLDAVEDRTALADWIARVLDRPAGSLHFVEAAPYSHTDQEPGSCH